MYYFKASEIVRNRLLQLFLNIVPGTLLCDELMRIRFRVVFYLGFWEPIMKEWVSTRKLTDAQKAQREELLREYKEEDMSAVINRKLGLGKNELEGAK